MDDRQVATLGVLIAGMGIVVALLTMPAWGDRGGLAWVIVIGGGLVATISCSAFRHDRADLSSARGGTALAGIVVAIGSALALVVPPNPVTDGYYVAVAAFFLVAAGLVGLATALYRDTPEVDVIELLGQLLFAGGIGLIGLFAAGIGADVLEILGGVILGDPAPIVSFGLRQIGVGIGFVVAAIGFLLGSGRGLEYLDLSVPDRRDVGYIIGGSLVILGTAVIIAIIYWAINVPSTEHALHRRGREEGAEFILYAIPFTWVGAALGEELLYRNVIQKYLGEAHAAITAILGASLIFAVVHIPAYAPASPLAISAALGAIFAMSLILAVSYHRTQNVVVPIVIHGIYNVVIYAGIYIELTGGL